MRSGGRKGMFIAIPGTPVHDVVGYNGLNSYAVCRELRPLELKVRDVAGCEARLDGVEAGTQFVPKVGFPIVRRCIRG